MAPVTSYRVATWVLEARVFQRVVRDPQEESDLQVV
jgi:hypothetical protein